MTPLRFSLRFYSEANTIGLCASDAITGIRVAACFPRLDETWRITFEGMPKRFMARDPAPGMRVPPVGILTPAIIKAMLLAAAIDIYEDIEVEWDDHLGMAYDT